MKKITVLIIPSHDFFSLYFLPSLPLQANGNNFLPSVSHEASFSYSAAERVAVVFLVLPAFCGKAESLLTHKVQFCWQIDALATVTLAESPAFRGPRCHSGTNAPEFSQIIPLWACLCSARRWSREGKIESIYLYNCLFVSASGSPVLIVVFIKGGEGIERGKG